MPQHLPSAADVVKALEAEAERGALTVRELAQAMDLTAAARPHLRRLLRGLVADGRLIAIRGRRFGLKSRLGDVVGRFSRHRAGYGFVVPDDPEVADVFIPPPAQGGAQHGDVVAARVLSVREDGKREGRIVRVVERGSSRLVGTFYTTHSGGGLVAPLDKGFGFDVLVPKDRTQDARSGEIVSLTLTDVPADGGAARGEVIERLGRPDDPGVDIEVLIRKYGLTPSFPEEVEQELAQISGDPDRWPLDGREDFTGDDVVTIDGETAKDFDDAICVRRTPAGGFRLDVHIADVAWFVREDSETDREALRRGTSVYFPGRAIPMLPERLSNDLCSLRPDEIRLTQGCTIEYDAKGKVKGTRFHEGFIRSKARLTYGEVARIVEAREPEARARRAPLLPMLDAAAELAGILTARRRVRGAIDFDLPEPEIHFALTGETADIVARPRNAAHRLIEEFMIAANEAVAEFLVRKKEPALYRIHERPDPFRAEKLAEALDGLGYTLPGPYEELEPTHFAQLIELAKGRAEEPFVVRLVLRSMSLARYSEDCLGHFGLALRRYLHFTSPIRRYPDLVVHRALRRLLSGTRETAGEREDRTARLPELARECSRLEREAEGAERESIAWKIASYMADRLGDEFTGRVVEVQPYGIMVALGEPAVEGLVHVSRLGTEYFRYDPKKQVLRGGESGKLFRLGQEVEVRVERVDAVSHYVDFALVTPTAIAPARKEKRSRRLQLRNRGGKAPAVGGKAKRDAKAKRGRKGKRK